MCISFENEALIRHYQRIQDQRFEERQRALRSRQLSMDRMIAQQSFASRYSADAHLYYLPY